MNLNLHSVSGQWPVFPKLGDCKITTDWKRYDFSFIAPNNVISIFLSGTYKGDAHSGEGTIWVDGLQMEKGELSQFTENPLCARLITSNPDNFLRPDEKINAHLNIFTDNPDNSGEVDIEVEDYNYRKIFHKKFKFKTDADGKTSIKLPFDGKFSRGIFVVKCSFSLENGYKSNDYFRFAIMDFLENKHKNKNITASGMDYFRIPRSEALLARCRNIGIGSGGYSQIASEEIRKMNEYGIDQEAGCILSYRTPQAGGIRIRGNAEKKDIIKPFLRIEKVTPELLKIIEDASYEKVKMYPLVKYWLFDGEPDQRHKYEGLFWADIIKIHEAAWRGVKKANPDAKFINGGPTNMMPRGGTEWVRKFMEAGGNKFCDGSEIHPYRTVPEDPDLDDDAVKYFSILDNCGMKNRPVFWLEGIYHTNYVLPAYGLDSHRACSADHYRCGAFSYHMGWGERIAAAYYARSWLVGLKYADRVKVYDGWAGKALYMDMNLTPYALQKVPNTIGRLLGNAVFKKDIRFAPNIRCYVFEDEKKRPVAAIWSYLPKVDRGYENAPLAVMPAPKGKMEFFDLMELAFSPEKNSNGSMKFSISPAPVFIRGEAGTIKSFCKILEETQLEGKEILALKISAKPSGSDKLDISVSNILTRPFEGKLKIGNNPEAKLNFDGYGTSQFIVSSEIQLPYDRIANINIPVLIEENNGKKYEMDSSFRGFAVKNTGSRKIVIDGKLDDWMGVSEIIMENRLKADGLFENKEKFAYPGDFDAKFKMLWDGNNLYLAVEVSDDKFVRVPDPSGNFNWQNDTLQTYIDTMCDAQAKVIRGFDTNDYEYDFFPAPSELCAVAFRRFAPEQQITGGTNPLKPNVVEPNIKTAFQLTEKGYIYEIAFPKEYIVPVKLKAGEICGFCIYLNDRDGETIQKKAVMKSALTLTPPGIGAFMNPHLYPVMLLSEEKSQ